MLLFSFSGGVLKHCQENKQLDVSSSPFLTTGRTMFTLIVNIFQKKMLDVIKTVEQTRIRMTDVVVVCHL